MNNEKHEVKFEYLTEENLKQMEQEQSHALMLLGFIGIVMLLNVVM